MEKSLLQFEPKFESQKGWNYNIWFLLLLRHDNAYSPNQKIVICKIPIPWITIMLRNAGRICHYFDCVRCQFNQTLIRKCACATPGLLASPPKTVPKPRGDCNLHFENTQYINGTFKMGHFKRSVSPCSEFHCLIWTHLWNCRSIQFCLKWV